VARITLDVVQTFTETDDGLVAGKPIECRGAIEAALRAQTLSMSKAGVVAWTNSVDVDTGEWAADPEILFQAGGIG
jgi:hypothetical protein